MKSVLYIVMFLTALLVGVCWIDRLLSVYVPEHTLIEEVLLILLVVWSAVSVYFIVLLQRMLGIIKKL